MNFYSHLNKIHFHKKGFALSLVLKVIVLWTWKWLIGVCFSLRFWSTRDKVYPEEHSAKSSVCPFDTLLSVISFWIHSLSFWTVWRKTRQRFPRYRSNLKKRKVSVSLTMYIFIIIIIFGYSFTCLICSLYRKK